MRPNWSGSIYLYKKPIPTISGNLITSSIDHRMFCYVHIINMCVWTLRPIPLHLLTYHKNIQHICLFDVDRNVRAELIGDGNSVVKTSILHLAKIYFVFHV